MKLKLLVLATLFTAGAQAAEVLSAKLDAAKKNILVDVSYGGGCKDHVFKLKLGGCLESFPVQCSAQLVETVVDGPDFCEAIVGETVKFSLKKYGLTDGYFKGGSLTIIGDKNFRGEDSSATVTLP
jgi:hypothetical protein